MGRLLRWNYLLLRSWDEAGFRGTVREARKRFIQKYERKHHEYGKPDRVILDVLFVNGCPPEQAPHPYRYRVLHQMEQLQAAGYTVAEIADHECTPETIQNGTIIVFYRCPYTEKLGEIIRQAKALNKRVVFDIDDLVIDTVYTDSIPQVQGMNRADRALYDEGVNRYGATMRMCDAATTTTTGMKREMEKFVSPVFVNRNCASERMARLSEEAWKKVQEERRDKELLKSGKESLFEKSESSVGGTSVKIGAARGKNGAGEGYNCPEVVLGYFSGSITHNADFEMILPAVLRVMDENPEVRLLLMGELDLPEMLKPYAERVIQKPFVDWEQLPEIIAGVDINLAPVQNTVFNEAKSENKWVEAALVKVPTVASRIGAFAEMIRDAAQIIPAEEEKAGMRIGATLNTVMVGSEMCRCDGLADAEPKSEREKEPAGPTGFLAGDDEWYDVLTRVVQDASLRTQVGENAYRYCREHCVTTSHAEHVRKIYEELRPPHAAFVLPSCELSGGIMVALRHACFLQDAGWTVDLIATTAKSYVWTEFGHSFECISYADGGCDLQTYYDLMVGTMWTTVDFIRSYPRVGKRAYLVQNYERDFYPWEDLQRLACEATYFLPKEWQYLTVSQWCQGWLWEKYGQEAAYLPNGLEIGKYPAKQRDWTGRKVRILIEGDSAVDYKNVDESFRIVDRLDREKFEIWYMSYNAEPKESYRYDKFLHAVPYDETPQVYADCDILLKSSLLESFSYPPLEMMATGGYCVVAPNGGNAEYLWDGENCLLYPAGDEDAAIAAIERILTDEVLRERLYHHGRQTAEGRDWNGLKSGIVESYRSLVEGNK